MIEKQACRREQKRVREIHTHTQKIKCDTHTQQLDWQMGMGNFAYTRRTVPFHIADEIIFLAKVPTSDLV